MRIIAGEYRGRVLKSPPDSRTRPTSDRLRETLFNILAPRIGEDTRLLDLCAGTGAIGIEALSRRAAFVTFVDKSRRACALIEENLDRLGIESEFLDLADFSKKFVLKHAVLRSWTRYPMTGILKSVDFERKATLRGSAINSSAGSINAFG